jgi:hypothetical protein
MPYNTRRKSLSLPSLGIHLPVSHASRAAARSPPSEQPPIKKIKRSHGSESPTPLSPASKSAPKTTILKYENTPPPSPDPEALELDDLEVKRETTEVEREIDLEGINDEIVEGVILQLQKTGSRPPLVQELATILSSSVKIVEMFVLPSPTYMPAKTLSLTDPDRSANPSAIISSRLSTYLKRPCWSALAPCPIAKELETVHPRRTYFYLTTYPHQPIPDPAHAAAVAAAAEAMRFAQRTIISPSLSSAASRSDEADTERRRELSPSPEVDLSAPEFDDVEDDGIIPPNGPFRAQIQHRDSAISSARNHRGASPPLEKDEKEFTQTARGMQGRKLSQDVDSPMEDSNVFQPSSALLGAEYTASRHMDLDGELFEDHSRTHLPIHLAFASSPAMRPLLISTALSKKGYDDSTESWEMEWDTRSPENIELDELDGLLDDF